MSGLCAPLRTITDEGGLSLTSGGPIQGVSDVVTLFAMTSGVAITNTNTEVSWIGSGVGSTTLGAGFWTVGRTVWIDLSGFVGAADLNMPAYTMKVKFASGGVLVGSAAMTNPNTAPKAWWLRAKYTCLTVGFAGTIIGEGFCSSGGNVEQGLVMTSAAVIDTTLAGAIDLTGTPGSMQAGDSLTSTNLTILAL